MTKFYGIVGYAITEETTPGVWEDKIVERPYYGDITKMGSTWSKSSYINDDLKITNGFSIVADAFAYQHYNSIKYIVDHETKWKVTNVTVDRPRLTLTVGSEYTEEEAKE